MLNFSKAVLISQFRLVNVTTSREIQSGGLVGAAVGKFEHAHRLLVGLGSIHGGAVQDFVVAHRQVHEPADALDRAKTLVAEHLDVLRAFFVVRGAELGHGQGIDVPAHVGN